MLQWSKRRKALWEAVTKVASLELSRRAEIAAAFTAEWTTQRPRPLRGGHCLLNFMSHEKRGPPLFHRECQKTPLPHLYLTHPVGLRSGRARKISWNQKLKKLKPDLTKKGYANFRKCQNPKHWFHDCLTKITWNQLLSKFLFSKICRTM